MQPDKPKKVKLDTGIIQGLNSQKENEVLKSLNQLRSSGSIHYIPELLRLMASTGNETVHKELVRFIADIKDPAALPFIIKALKTKEFVKIRSSIISACWQSSLDFRTELSLFVEIFLDADYATAIECFSVIEESAMEMETEEVQKLRELIIFGLVKISDEKKPLANELIRSLETM